MTKLEIGLIALLYITNLGWYAFFKGFYNALREDLDNIKATGGKRK